jgi:ATP-dependent RNA helicase DeaD
VDKPNEQMPAEQPAAQPDASDYVAAASFDDLKLSEPVRKGVADRGYVTPTPVQAATFGPILAGRDVIVRSKTGTGKTAAFGIPMLERIPAGRRRTSGLVLCPTRELALQVAQEIAALAAHKDVSVVAVYGGAAMGEQTEKLRAGAEIVVGTPGRVIDHIDRGNLKLDGVMIACLDEADEMLNMGFFEDVTGILDRLPADVQQLLFSATVPADIEHLIQKYLTSPETILLSGDEYSVENIQNVIYPTVDAYPKPRNLLYMIETEEPETAIVFANTRTDTALVAAVLNRNGYDAELLNGDLPQKERERVMAKVKRGEVRFMVATDIAARGIDISDLSHVINYSLPEDPAVYLHRVGRTGRIGKKGTAISLVSGAEMMTLRALRGKYGIQFEERKLPTPEEARRAWSDRHVAELKEAMSSSIYEGFIPLAQELRERPGGDLLVAFALKYFFTHHRIEKVHDREKAEHKKEEHFRREQGAVEREARPRREHGAGAGEGARGGGRGGRSERGGRGERGRGEGGRGEGGRGEGGRGEGGRGEGGRGERRARREGGGESSNPPESRQQGERAASAEGAPPAEKRAGETEQRRSAPVPVEREVRSEIEDSPDTSVAEGQRKKRRRRRRGGRGGGAEGAAVSGAEGAAATGEGSPSGDAAPSGGERGEGGGGSGAGETGE